MATRVSKNTRQTAVEAPDRRRLPIVLRRAWYGLNQAFRRRILHLGITPDQFTALRNLHEAGDAGLIQCQLTERMSSDPNTIASLVDRMRKAALIDREPDTADRRANRLRINASGRKKFQEARKIAVQLQSSVLEVLPQSQRDTFLEQLMAVADACLDAAENSPKK